jgi:hypothetical protein
VVCQAGNIILRELRLTLCAGRLVKWLAVEPSVAQIEELPL